MTLLYSNVLVSHNSVTMSQRERYQDPETEADKMNSVTHLDDLDSDNFIYPRTAVQFLQSTRSSNTDSQTHRRQQTIICQGQ